MDKRFLSILAGLVVIFGGIFIVSQHSSNSSSGSSNSNGAQTTNHIQGEGSTGVTLQEYGDFECPICQAYYQPLKEVQAQMNKEIFFQFSNLPLVQIHPNAFAGARAAEASDLQGKYWPMHDKLYENQSSWATAANPLEFFKGYAKDLGLNVTKFTADYASSTANDRINADLAAFGKTNQPQATPTFFLDGKVLDNKDVSNPQTGAPDVNKFIAVINAEIAKKSGTKSGN
jgi:protein-disulfide isomerase